MLSSGKDSVITPTELQGYNMTRRILEYQLSLRGLHPLTRFGESINRCAVQNAVLWDHIGHPHTLGGACQDAAPCPIFMRNLMFHSVQPEFFFYLLSHRNLPVVLMAEKSFREDFSNRHIMLVSMNLVILLFSTSGLTSSLQRCVLKLTVCHCQLVCRK